MRLFSTATSSDPELDNDSFFGARRGSAQAGGIWHDIVHVAGHAPAALQLHFAVHGVLHVDPLDDLPPPGELIFQFQQNFTRVRFGASETSPLLGEEMPFLQELLEGHDNPTTYARLTTTGNFTSTPGIAFGADGWDFYQAISDPLVAGTWHFAATFSANISYNEQWGGYPYLTYVITESFGNHGRGTGDLLNTASLVAVTNLDGSPLAGVSFDSGMQLGAAAVPEPTSLLIWCLAGSAMAVGHAKRRQRRM
jgi:hypothetical protein